jgi:hypothetical protein
MVYDLFMNTHTIKSKYNFILHLDLFIQHFHSPIFGALHHYAYNTL